ncbi:HAD family hydrolase [Palleronia pelagia]|uniref:Haloacid dehalogenase superfamily, subfamily IA, variant 3 with third motif having DD or ED n=1 Tax=Palleronia pelagia TaxID=387096 RepID=A0A1H8JGU4_9RHOB|nr:HAD-IA family hydrolase [Palleronia pelagia]SEN79447.1 haloacid dehalogenase superfamily, subfamily IA, variant 3 with third motif having DD or ED [Palleronia pelagia]
MPAFLIGSIGVLAETSHLQRDAFNLAFREAGLDWHWSEDAYAAMLTRSGGAQRIRDYADNRDQRLDVGQIHRRKTEIFCDKLAEGVPLREGVADTLDETRAAGWRLGFVTTTSAANVDCVLDATGLSRGTFDTVVTRGDVVQSKPAPDAYYRALAALDCTADGSIAIEDNPDGVTAAKDAGLTCFALPGRMHAQSNFAHADMVLDRLAPAVATRSS